MFPQNLKQLFGLNSQKDQNMANNIWKMLDEMSQNSPQQYKQFIQKNIHEGVQQVKSKKDQKQKPFKFKPEKGFLLEFDVILNQKILTTESSQSNQEIQKIHNKLGGKLEQKLILNQQKWIQIKNKFKRKLHVLLSVCHSDRIKRPLNKSQKSMQNINLQNIKQIEVFYYSLQGPTQKKQKTQLIQLQYVMILNSRMYNQLMSYSQPGKKLLMSLALSYFEQRFQNDHNPLLKLYNPKMFQKLAFYAIEKLSIQLNSTDKIYFYDNKSQISQFLIQKQIDSKRQKQLKQQQAKIKNQIAKKNSNIKKAQQIKFKKQQQSSSQINNYSLLSGFQNKSNQTTQQSSNIRQQKKQQKKKPLIEILNETQQKSQIQTNIIKQFPYELRQTQNGYHIEILTPGIKSLDQLNLQINSEKIKLKAEKNSDLKIQIQLNKPINVDNIKAKFKKKLSRLVIQAPFYDKNI